MQTQMQVQRKSIKGALAGLYCEVDRAVCNLQRQEMPIPFISLLYGLGS